MIYDLYSPVHNVLGACISITKASGRGLGPGIRDFFYPFISKVFTKEESTSIVFPFLYESAMHVKLVAKDILFAPILSR
jgi:hypothetical protein